MCTKYFTYTKKFYGHEIAAVHLLKIYFLKNAKKTCKPNLNRDWITTLYVKMYASKMYVSKMYVSKMVSKMYVSKMVSKSMKVFICIYFVWICIYYFSVYILKIFLKTVGADRTG